MKKLLRALALAIIMFCVAKVIILSLIHVPTTKNLADEIYWAMMAIIDVILFKKFIWDEH